MAKGNNRDVVRAHLQRALDEIQEAQNGVTRALQHLAPITGGAPTYTKGHKLYDQVHAYWYRVRKLIDRLDSLGLDHDPGPRELGELGLPAQPPAKEVG